MKKILTIILMCFIACFAAEEENVGTKDKDSSNEKGGLCTMAIARCNIDIGFGVHGSLKGFHTSDEGKEKPGWQDDGSYSYGSSGNVKYGPDDIFEISFEPVGVSAYLLLYKIIGVRLDYVYSQYSLKKEILTENSPISSWKVNNETLVTSLMLSVYKSNDRIEETSSGCLIYLLLGKSHTWRTDELIAKEGVYIDGDPRILADADGFIFATGLIFRVNSYVGLQIETGFDVIDFEPVGDFALDEDLGDDGGFYLKLGLSGFWEIDL